MAPISRITLACLACRTKKTRCGGQKPGCDNCAKAGIDCSYNARSDQRKPYSKAFVSTLQARINSLEKELERHVAKDRQTSRAPELANSRDRHTPEPLAAARPLNEGELVGQLANRGGNLLRHADTSTSELQGTFRFYGASSSRNFQVAHRTRPFDFARLARQTRLSLRSAGFAPDLERCEMALGWYEAYFANVNPVLMVLEQDIFYEHLERGDAASLLSSSLLNAVAAVGAFASGNRAGCETHLDRARLAMDVESATPQLTSIQALILMGYCEAACGRESRGWLFYGMATRIALELGVARDSHEYVEMGWMTVQDMRARHRTLWALFILDKLLSLFYGRPASLDAAVISATAPSPKHRAQGSLSIPCPRPDDCARCTQWDDYTVCMYELTNYSVEIYERLYANPVLKADASSRWTGWASDLNLRLAQWSADLPRPLKCTFTRGQVPSPSTISLHLLYHSLIILLNRPFLPLGAHMPEAAFSAKSCHLASRSIARLAFEMQSHHRLELAHNYIVYAVHTAITIALLNSKSSTGTVQREARNDLKSLVRSLDVLSYVHLNAANIYRLITDLVRRSFVDEREWVDTVCERESDVTTPHPRRRSTAVHLPPSHTPAHHSAFPMDIGAVLQDEQPFSDADLSQFALVDWDSYAALGFGDNVIGGIDIQPWLK